MDVLQKLGIDKSRAVGSCAGVGKWLSGGKRMVQSITPATGQALAQVATCSAEDYETIINASQTFQRRWAQVPAPKRGEVIRRLGNLLRENKDALGSLVSMEMGKIKQEGDGEVQEMIDMADMAVGQSRMLYGKTMHSERPAHRMYEQWHPIGVVGVISAFNFPVAVWAWNAFIAAIAGDSVIWKPSSKTPLCAIAVQNLCNQVMKEMDCDGLFTLMLPENHQTAERFVGDKRIPLISFTGSSPVGQKVAVQVAARMGRSLLECSGNNAIIVDETADLNLVVPAIVFGAVGTAGQRCTTTRRLFVHTDIYDDLVERIVHAYRQVRVGDPLDSKILMGPLIDEAAVVDYEKAIATAVQAGGKILTGGKRIQRPGHFVEPTIVAVSEQLAVVEQETFAPILYVMRFQKLDDAIAAQNAVPQGLSSAMFTNNLRAAEQFLSAGGSDCGIANINIGTSGAEIGGAFGGEKDTGGGREAGSDCWKLYMRRQTNTINWSRELPLAQGIQFNISS